MNKSILRMGIGVVAAAASAMAISPFQAHATGTSASSICGASTRWSFVGGQSIHSQGHTGELMVYRSGNNYCGYMLNQSGSRQSMHIDGYSNYTGSRSDSGNYSSYAGPVKVYHAPNGGGMDHFDAWFNNDTKHVAQIFL